jgi:hypothetical protein
MSHPWLELVPALEAIELDLYFRDPEGLTAAMRLRHELIQGLAKADARLLEPEQREDLTLRLRKVLERDQIIIRALTALKDVVLGEMAQQNTGKRAMNGYKATVNSEPPPVRRIG